MTGQQLPEGATYRQLSYWVQRGWLRPGNAGRGSGHDLVWDDDELAVAVRMIRLVRAGLTPAAAAKVARDHTTCELAPGITVSMREVP